MGVYIDIEMPRCCADCAFFVQLAGSDVTECVMPEGRVGQWCPLEETDRSAEVWDNEQTDCAWGKDS